MSIRLLIGVAFLVGCALPTHPVGNSRECSPGGECTVNGVLIVDGPWETTLKVSEGCIALALPETYHPPKRSLVNRSIRVSGFAMTQPEMFGSEYFYQVEGRRVNRNNCRFVIIVSAIADAHGNKLWEQ